MADSLIYAGIRRRRRQVLWLSLVSAVGFLLSLGLLANLL